MTLEIFYKLFFTFIKIGSFTFGGGYAMIPLFYAELVEKYHLITAEKFSNIVAISQITPGPIGINAATYIGYINGGFLGACMGTLGLLIPSVIIISIVNKFFEKFRKSKLIENTLFGVRPAIVGLIFAAVVFFANESMFIVDFSLKAFGEYNVRFGIRWQGILIFITAIILAKKFKLSVIWVLVISAVLGLILFRF